MNFRVSFTRNYSSPDARTHPSTDDPMQVAKLLRALYVHVSVQALAWTLAVAPGSSRQDLLRHGHAHGQSLNLFAMASSHSDVDRLPPTSRVHSPARMADSTAPSIALAISVSPRCLTIIDALK